MSLSITSNFTGDHAGQYLAAALKAAKSLDYLTLVENVKYKRNISLLAPGARGAEYGTIQDATCDFTKKGTLTMTEKILEPKALQVNMDFCKKDLLADWQSLQMGAGAHNRNFSPDFQSFVIGYIAAQITDAVELDVWSGAKGNAGEFDGLLAAFTADAVTTCSKSGAFSATTMVTELSTLVANIPANVYANAAEDLYIYMNPKAYRFYISEMSTAGYVDLYSMNDTYQPFFEGIKIAVCPGMPDDNMVAAQSSNMFFGTDLLSDTTEIKLLDMSDLDGSDNIRCVAKYTAGTQTGVAKDITHMS